MFKDIYLKLLCARFESTVKRMNNCMRKAKRSLDRGNYDLFKFWMNRADKNSKINFDLLIAIDRAKAL